MEWVLIWLCSQCDYDLQLIYAANSEARVRQVAEALSEDGVPGGYFVAKLNAGFEHEQRIIWNETTKRVETLDNEGRGRYDGSRPKILGRGPGLAVE